VGRLGVLTIALTFGKQKAFVSLLLETRRIPDLLAERVGFEPTVRETAHLISNQAHSTTLAPLLCSPDKILGSKASLVKYAK
jgi:hypothetical protein